MTQDSTVKWEVMRNRPFSFGEDETTIIVPSSRIAIAQEDGCIDLVQKAS